MWIQIHDLVPLLQIYVLIKMLLTNVMYIYVYIYVFSLT